MRNNKDFGLSDSLLDAVRQVVEKKLDPVDPKELKGKHKDREDKDIDNDGDVDSTDKFLHRRRKAITKAIAKKESVEEGRGGDKKNPNYWKKGAPAKPVAPGKPKPGLSNNPKSEGAMSRMAYQKQSGEKGSGLKTFKPKPPAKTEGKKDLVDVKPKMEASELPKK